MSAEEDRGINQSWEMHQRVVRPEKREFRPQLYVGVVEGNLDGVSSKSTLRSEELDWWVETKVAGGGYNQV